MRIYIDCKTGTWGNVDDLCTIEIDPTALNVLDNMSDAQVIEFGKRNGDHLNRL